MGEPFIRFGAEVPVLDILVRYVICGDLKWQEENGRRQGYVAVVNGISFPIWLRK